MILPIEIYGSRVLRKVSEEIGKDYPDLQTLINNMFETMRKADGIGLAAPQIGKNIRVVTIDASGLSDDKPELENFIKILINPEIITKEGEAVKYSEGCLSLPGINEEVERPENIHVSYYDENFQYQEEFFEGIKSRIIQHEYDHLEGILFVDRINPLRKKMIRGKLHGMVKGKVEASYKVKCAR